MINPRNTYQTVIVTASKKNGQTEDDVMEQYDKVIDPKTFSTAEEIADCLQFRKDAATAHGLFEYYYVEQNHIDHALFKMRLLPNLVKLISGFDGSRSDGRFTWDDLIRKIRAFGPLYDEEGEPRYYESSSTASSAQLVDDSD